MAYSSTRKPTPDEALAILREALGALDSYTPVAPRPGGRTTTRGRGGSGGETGSGKKKSGGWLDTGPLGVALDVLDAPRAGVFSFAKELGDAVSGTDDDPTTDDGGGFSLKDWWDQTADQDERIYGQDFLYGNHEKGIGAIFDGGTAEDQFAKGNKLGGFGRLAAGLAFDIGLDPLTYVGGVGLVDEAFKGAKVAANTEKAVEAARAAKRAEQLAEGFSQIERSGDPVADALRALELSQTDEAVEGVARAGTSAASGRQAINDRALKYGTKGLSNAELAAEYGVDPGTYARVFGTGMVGRRVLNVGRRAAGMDPLRKPSLYKIGPRSEKLAGAVGKLQYGLGAGFRKIPKVAALFGGSDQVLKEAALGRSTVDDLDQYGAAQALRSKRRMPIKQKFRAGKYLDNYDQATKQLDETQLEVLGDALRGDPEAVARLGDKLAPVRGTYDSILADLGEAGSDLNRVDDYLPNLLTPEARQVLLGLKEFKGHTAANVGQAFFEKARTLVPDAQGNVSFAGRTWKFKNNAQNAREGTRAVRELVEQNPGKFDGVPVVESMFQNDARSVFATYAEAAAWQIERNEALRELAQKGVGYGDARVRDTAWLTPEDKALVRDLEKKVKQAERDLRRAKAEGRADDVAAFEERISSDMEQIISIKADAADRRVLLGEVRAAERQAKRLEKRFGSLKDTEVRAAVEAQYRAGREGNSIAYLLNDLRAGIAKGEITIEEAQELLRGAREIKDQRILAWAPPQVGEIDPADTERLEELLKGREDLLALGRTIKNKHLDSKVLRGELSPGEADQLRLENWIDHRIAADQAEAEMIAAGQQVKDLSARLDSLQPHEFVRLAKFAQEEIRAGLAVQVRAGYLTPAEATNLFFSHEKFVKAIPVVTRIVKWMAAWQIATPGFVHRNILGGVWNNTFYKTGVPAESYAEVRRLMFGLDREGNSIWRRPVRGKLTGTYQKRLSDADIVLRDQILQSVGRGQVGSEFAHAQDWAQGRTSVKSGTVLPTSRNYVPLAARAYNQRAETLLRGALAHAVIKDGGNVDEAIDWVFKLHFDYDDLSHGERVIKQVMPFYTWTRKNFPLQVEMLLSKPKNFQRYGLIQEQLGEASGDGLYQPEYYGREGFIKTPFTVGGNEFFLAPDLPLRDINRTSEMLTLGLSQGKFDPTVALGGVSPVFKGPIEYWAGKQVFKGLPLRDKEAKVVALPTAIAPTIGPVMRRFNHAHYQEGKWWVSERDLYALAQTFPQVGQLNRLWPSDPSKQEQLVSAWLSWAGFGTRTLTQDQSEAAYYYEQEKKPVEWEQAVQKTLDRLER